MGDDNKKHIGETEKAHKPKDTEDVSEEQNVEERCEQERDEYKQKYLRALADYQNLDRRAREDREANTERGKTQTVVAFLPILDSLEQAEVFVTDPGLKMVKDQFLTTLHKMGVVEIELMGTEYDPLTAEVVDIVPSEKDNEVVEVVRKGYMMNDRIIRIAHVKVGKKITS